MRHTRVFAYAVCQSRCAPTIGDSSTRSLSLSLSFFLSTTLDVAAYAGMSHGRVHSPAPGKKHVARLARHPGSSSVPCLLQEGIGVRFTGRTCDDVYVGPLPLSGTCSVVVNAYYIGIASAKLSQAGLPSVAQSEIRIRVVWMKI